MYFLQYIMLSLITGLAYCTGIIPVFPDCVCTGDSFYYCCDGQTTSLPSECSGFCPGRERCVIGICDSDPVCCNRVDYSSLQEAKLAGVDPSSCFNAPCGAISYLACTACSLQLVAYCCNGKQEYLKECFPTGCAASVDTLVCTRGQCETAVACTTIYDPVCCEGVTYSNECVANAEGVSSSTCCPGECVARPVGSPFCSGNFVWDFSQSPVCCGSLFYSSRGAAFCEGQFNCVPKL
eukprot:TRINITY_DN768_c1_g1_i2.p3 TRINITY_DN768_c1_g1~~TRINITY_DN768_c1_g1_i2.p3  ORF type:complete len:237 (+),score=8.54 TRINITY_DN768_c1_g1_i2:147-857(+)